MTTAQHWYVTLDGKEQGPFDPSAVRLLVDQGRIGATTPMRRGDLAASVPAGTIKGLLPATTTVKATTATAAVSAKAATQSVPAPAGATVRTTRQAAKTTTVAAAPAAPPEEPAADDGAAPEDAPPEAADRAEPGKRLLAGLIDLVLIGGAAGALIALGVLGNLNARRDAIAEIDAGRAKMNSTEKTVLGYEAWPVEREPTVKRVEELQNQLATLRAQIPKRGPKDEPSDAVREIERQVAVTDNELTYKKQLVEFYDKLGAAADRRIANDEAKAHTGMLIKLLFAALILAFVHPICEGLLGGTPGKLAFGLRVAGPGRRAANSIRVLQRHLYRAAIGGQFRCFASPDRLCLHDQLSRTEVVPAAAIVTGGRRTAAPTGGTGRVRRR